MKHEDIKLQCLSIANGNLEQAKAMYDWITENAPLHNPVMSSQNYYKSGLPGYSRNQGGLKGGVPGAG